VVCTWYICAGESGSREEMCMTQFIALLGSVASVHKDKAKALFTSFRVQMHEGGPMGDPDAWEETQNIDFRRFLLGAASALEDEGRETKFNLLFRIYDSNDDGVSESKLPEMFLLF
jgi:Ca2+-binding EF-hand superfamily protein